MSSELEDAIHRAEAELAQTRAAIDAARGTTVEQLAADLAKAQLELGELEAQVQALDAALAPRRAEEERILEALK
jgi:chromosome segregation ATPase